MGIQITKKGGRTVAVPEKLARALVRSGRFTYATSELMPVPAYEPESEHKESQEPITAKPRRVYKRRDMKAED